MNFKTIMIYVDDDPVSKAYVDTVRTSWDGFGLQFYKAVTPLTLDQQSGLTFGQRGSSGKPRDLTNTEKACLYSQYNLWRKCAIENVPILILEHDALCVRPQQIKFNPHLDVQFLGQHAMEAVMFHPRFAKRIVRYCENNEVTGPMQLVDGLLGYFNRGEQSRYGRPHARYMGPNAPVRSVIDPLIGTTVQHDGTTVDRLEKDRDLFEIVNISESYLHYKK
jgi:hypothetical protein